MRLEPNHTRRMRAVPNVKPRFRGEGRRVCCGCREMVRLVGDGDLCGACLDALGERIRRELADELADELE